jgi:hypothetical protein
MRRRGAAAIVQLEQAMTSPICRWRCAGQDIPAAQHVARARIAQANKDPRARRTEAAVALENTQPRSLYCATRLANPLGTALVLAGDLDRARRFCVRAWHPPQHSWALGFDGSYNGAAMPGAQAQQLLDKAWMATCAR